MSPRRRAGGRCSAAASARHGTPPVEEVLGGPPPNRPNRDSSGLICSRRRSARRREREQPLPPRSAKNVPTKERDAWRSRSHRPTDPRPWTSAVRPVAFATIGDTIGSPATMLRQVRTLGQSACRTHWTTVRGPAARSVKGPPAPTYAVTRPPCRGAREYRARWSASAGTTHNMRGVAHQLQGLTD